VGHAPHGQWAAGTVVQAGCEMGRGGFGPMAFDLIFLFSEYIQILANSKFCVGFI
jgi:hypothetical protein